MAQFGAIVRLAQQEDRHPVSEYRFEGGVVRVFDFGGVVVRVLGFGGVVTFFV